MNNIETKTPSDIIPKVLSINELHPPYITQRKPEEGKIDYRNLVLSQFQDVLTATNQIRNGIEKNKYNNMTAKQVFHTFHHIHVGEDDALKNAVQAADFGDIDLDYQRQIWDALKHSAEHLESDQSCRYGMYRNSIISWDEPGRGIMGMHIDDIPEFAEKVFALIDKKISEARNGNRMNPDDAIRFSIMVATVIDVAHFKKDCNGRTAEDFMVWIQSQLIESPKDRRFLSDHGLRAPGLQNSITHSDGSRGPMVEEEYIDMIQDTRDRIDSRNFLATGIRQEMYSMLGKIIRLNDEEITNIMKDVNNPEKQNELRKATTQIFNDMLAECETIGRPELRRKPESMFDELVEYYMDNKINKYKTFNPKDVFLPQYQQ